MYLDLYALQSVPPSNINRDDTGSPKTAMYGGALRARVSSQAWKRAMREMFSDLLPEGQLGVRTKFVVPLIADRIAAKREGLAEQSVDFARAVLDATGIKSSETDRKGSDEGTLATGYLVFIANRELDELADIAISWADGGVDPKKPDSKSKKDVQKAFKGIQAVDIALFGRMLADASDFNVDACAQVAHAISVNEISQEYDYFTAVDDCAADDNAGAGMLGTVSFNSSTLYRYATVNVEALMEQLESSEATARGVAAFVEAFVKSMPTGKQNTFANRTLPNVVAVSLRDDQPINLATAFECPVYAERERSITQIASERLVACAKDVEGAFAHPASKSWHVSYGVDAAPLEYFGEGVSFDDLVTAVREAIESALAFEE